MIGCIVQARVGSKRLPGKVNEKINGKTVLQHLIERLQKAKLLDCIVIAAPDTEQDKQLAETAEKCGVGFFQGSEQNVLDRFIKCAERFGFDTVVRVCADSLFTSPLFLDETVREHIAKGNDYTSADRQLPEGTWAEAVSLHALRRAQKEARGEKYAEHVTLYIRERPKEFRIGCIGKSEKKFKPESIGKGENLFRQGLKLSIDTTSDLALVKAIVERIGKPVAEVEVREIVGLFDKDTTLFEKYSSGGKPFVSVMINTYNYGKTLGKAILSALNQTMPSTDFEVIVVDDGSTDNTQQVLKRFAWKIRVFRQKHKGAYAANNLAFKSAKGKYVIKLDADDWFEKDILQKMFNALEKAGNAGFAYADVRHVRNGKKRVVSLRKFDVFKTIACGIMFRKKGIIELNGEEKMYNEKLFFPEYDLLLRLSRKRKGVYVGGPYYNYFRHGKSLTADKRKVAEGLRQIKELHAVKGNLPLEEF